MQGTRAVGASPCDLVRIRHLDPAVQIVRADFILDHRAQRDLRKHNRDQVIAAADDGLRQGTERKAETTSLFHAGMIKGHGFACFGKEVDDLADTHGGKVALELRRIRKHDPVKQGARVGI